MTASEAPSREATYSLAEVAALSKVGAATVRWYAQLGLVGPAESADDASRYSPADLRRLEFLERLRTSGMSATDMRLYVELAASGDHTIPRRRSLLEAHRRRLLETSEELQATARYLNWKIAFYREKEAARAVATDDGRPDEDGSEPAC
jgi:DNA-binding transcriptional MerR regulator